MTINPEASKALDRLKEGNQRFLDGAATTAGHLDAARRLSTVAEQRPFAIILGCSDSRVPAEIVFDQGLGDLFVIRVAGNVVAPSQVGSVEFATEMFGTPLVVVLGHSSCGAIIATLDQLRQQSHLRSQNLHAIVDRIRPAVEPLLAGSGDEEEAVTIARAVRNNIQTSVENLAAGSEILSALIEQHRLNIVGAEYCLSSGEVEFLDLPEAGGTP